MNFLKGILFIVTIVFFITSASAQSKMQVAKMKQRVMTELKVDDVKADSAINIVTDFYKNARSIRNNSDLKDEDRKSALQTNRKAEMSRLRAAGFTMEQMQKLKQVLDEMKEERQNRKGLKDSTSAS